LSANRGSGKWGNPKFPKKGWFCDGVTDVCCRDSGCSCCLETCEMCEYREIRYVHHMIHPVYGLELDTGCVCASRMEINPDAAKTREGQLKNATRRRRNWLSRKWRISAKGNHFLNTDGMNIVIYRVLGGWGGRITERSDEDPRVVPSRRVHPTIDAAKLAAFDTMILLKDRWHL